MRGAARAGGVVLALALSAPVVPPAMAQKAGDAASPAAGNRLTVLRGNRNSRLTVAVDRALVVESEVPFVELSVANPAIADIATLSDRTIYVLGKAPGRTTLTLLGPNGTLISNVQVSVLPDIAEFKERLREILPKERIEVRTANDGIVLSGQVSSARKLSLALELGERYAPGKVTNLMTVGGTQQVLLKVRFAEMQRSVKKSLSASLGISDSGSLTQGGSNSYADSFDPSAFTDGLPTTGTGSTQTGALGVAFTAGGLQMAVLLEALESKGLVRTLAEPNLVAVSGSSARFLAGGEYPIPVSDGTVVTIQYKPFGVELEFTPVVIDDNLISLTLRAAVSSIDTTVTVSQTGGITANGFKKRETTTTIQMRDGQSFAIAGLLQDDFTDLVGQVPWLGDIPVLGALFRSSEFERKQSELVIIVTPHLVTPVKGEALTLPTDRVRLPSEGELFMLGRTAGAKRGSKAADELSTQGLKGPYGYVME